MATDPKKDKIITITGDFSQLYPNLAAEVETGAAALLKAFELSMVMPVPPQPPDLHVLSDVDVNGAGTNAVPDVSQETCSPHEAIERIDKWNRGAARREVAAKRRLCEIFGLPITATIPTDDNYPVLCERTEALAHQRLNLAGDISFAQVLTHHEVAADGDVARGLARKPAMARSRVEKLVSFESTLREMRAANLSHKEMCDRLDTNGYPTPDSARWRGLTWRKAYRDNTACVRKWLSKHSR
jgi:hypothetical protein